MDTHDALTNLLIEFQMNCQMAILNLQLLNYLHLCQITPQLQPLNLQTFAPPPPSSDASGSSSDLVSSSSIPSKERIDSNICVYDGMNILRATTHGRFFRDLYEFEDAVRNLLTPLIRSELQSGPKKIIIVLKFFPINYLTIDQFVEFVQIITLHGLLGLYDRIQEFNICLIDTLNGDREADDRATVILANKLGGKVITNDGYSRWDLRFVNRSIRAYFYEFYLDKSGESNVYKRLCRKNIPNIDEIANTIPCIEIFYSQRTLDSMNNLRPQSRQGFIVESDGTTSSRDLHEPRFAASRKRKQRSGPNGMKKPVGKSTQTKYRVQEKEPRK